VLQSGISKAEKLPKVLPYPQLLPFESTPSIHNIFCYIIKHYGYIGLSVLIYRQRSQDQVVTICGDWAGNNIDIVNNDDKLATLGMGFVQKELTTFLQTMNLIKLNQAQFFFSIDPSDNLVLVDMQVAFNKFASPGMIRDIFGNIFNVQEVIKTEIIDARVVETIQKGTGSYEGDIILKPTKFRMYHEAENNSFQPLYVEVKR
tara:strand:- start:2538 stop:3146 length:609 start_codon:yes stop_codon:yes gene_type:complete